LCAAVHEAAEQFGQSPQVDIGRSGETPSKMRVASRLKP
jgi:hypothetical protein